MDALIYEDTPQASYFEGDAIPYELPHDQNPPSPLFAPRRIPDFKRRLRRIRRSATSIAPGSAYTDELLERFRYIIVASQLLSDDAGPHLSLPDHKNATSDLTTLRGAVITAIASFVTAWAIHRFSRRKKVEKALTLVDVGTYCMGLVLVSFVAILFGRRQYANYLQRASVRTLKKVVDDSHGLDTTINHAIRFIQEVEVVARGYDLNGTFPPITRLEDRQLVRRCQTLRRSLAAALKALTIVMVLSHNMVKPHVDDADAQRYHDIYEVSLVEYTQAVDLVQQPTSQVNQSLKELRFAVGLYTLSRKVLFCELLALRQTKGGLRLHQWSRVLRTLQNIERETVITQVDLSQTLAEEEWGTGQPRRESTSDVSQSDEDSSHSLSSHKMQLRRLDDIAHAVRSLNAKVYLMREELVHGSSEDSFIVPALTTHYDSLGVDIRNLLSDWERGKSSILSQVDADLERRSCSTNSVRTPTSPSPPHTSLQIVDGGPADALRLLNGDSLASDHREKFEEEVFEAVANRLPRKQMSMGGMTREEKIAKLAEDRRKRQTFQEQSDNTTNMLRELQMVIKHRPKASLPPTTSTSSTISSNRVVSL